MSKGQFVACLLELKSIIDDTEQVHKAMKKLSPDFGGFYNERAETLVFNVLQDIFNDKENDWIGYFIYELEWGKKYRKGMIKSGKNEIIKLASLDDLYKLITENYVSK
jgi:hypothetical protein